MAKDKLITIMKTCSAVKINYFGLSQVNPNFAYPSGKAKVLLKLNL